MTDAAVDAQPLAVDLEEFRADPHAAFRRVRPLAPLVALPGPMLLATRFADVDAMLTDPRTRQVETEGLQLRAITSGPLWDFFSNVMLTSNAPAHPRRRAPVARTFVYKLMDAWRPAIRALAHALIDENRARGAMDLRDDFAALIPARIIAKIIGLPEREAPRFTSIVYRFSRGLSGFADDQLADINAAGEELRAYVEATLNNRRATPQDDFISAYAASVDAAGDLTEMEVIAQIMGLILAGSDTTRMAITVMVSMLLERPDQWEAVRDDPTLAKGAAAEALRMEPPVGGIPRIPSEPIEVGGVRVAAESFLVMSTLAALRDPAQFTDPDTFDVRRADHPKWHLAFGAGVHKCLGEALARAEMEEALIAIAEALPDLRLTGGPARVKGFTALRGVDPLPVAWG